MFNVYNVVTAAQNFIADGLSENALTVDATTGNGYDTLFLARQLKGNGIVYSFDIQKQALEKAAELIRENDLANKVKFIHDSHENIADYIHEPLDAVMFNLGYLPGGDHNIITKPDSTIRALAAAIKLLKVGGKISLAVYVGHQGGPEELAAVEDYVEQLEARMYRAIKVTTVNRNSAPVLFLMERVG